MKFPNKRGGSAVPVADAPVTLQLWHKQHTILSKASPFSLDRIQARNERTDFHRAIRNAAPCISGIHLTYCIRATALYLDCTKAREVCGRSKRATSWHCLMSSPSSATAVDTRQLSSPARSLAIMSVCFCRHWGAAGQERLEVHCKAQAQSFLCWLLQQSARPA